MLEFLPKAGFQVQLTHPFVTPSFVTRRFDMASASETRASLLLRIRDPQDRIAWNEFVALYAPLLHAYGMKHSLQDADAADLVQEVLRRVNRALPQFDYDRQKGTFRGWLLTVTRNEIRKMAKKAQRHVAGTGDTQVNSLLAEHAEQRQDDDEWEREYRWNLFYWAAERIKVEFREKTWNAFWLTVVENQPVEKVAQELGVSTGAVYIARSRVTARIRQEVAVVEGE